MSGLFCPADGPLIWGRRASAADSSPAFADGPQMALLRKRLLAPLVQKRPAHLLTPRSETLHGREGQRPALQRRRVRRQRKRSKSDVIHGSDQDQNVTDFGRHAVSRAAAEGKGRLTQDGE